MASPAFNTSEVQNFISKPFVISEEKNVEFFAKKKGHFMTVWSLTKVGGFFSSQLVRNGVLDVCYGWLESTPGKKTKSHKVYLCAANGVL